MNRQSQSPTPAMIASQRRRPVRATHLQTSEFIFARVHICTNPRSEWSVTRYPSFAHFFTRANLLEQQFKVEPRGEAIWPNCAKRDNAIGHRGMREVDRINIHGAAGEASEVGLGESADCRERLPFTPLC